MVNLLSLEVKTFLKVCESVNSPRSLACSLLIRNGEWEQYFSMAPPFRGPSTDAFKLDYLVTEMLTKNADVDIGIDKRAVALEKFRKTELSCKSTNDRITSIVEGQSAPPEFLRDVRYWISRILGNLSKEKLRYVEDSMRFGPGATSSCVGADVTPSNKYACDVHTTLRLRPYVRAIMGPHWSATPFGEVYVNDISKVTTVPKNAKTDRVICIEPHLNVYVQLGIGALLRTRLRRFGIDLDTQEWNQHLASCAGEYRLATVDLSSASDMVSFNVVKYLLPKEWFDLLYLCRTDHSVVDGEIVTLEKFSSMGNGYTFELESLIFTAVALAAGADRRLMAVYGDDIILERSCYPRLLEILTFLGFEVNGKKTFVEGNFYESCGTDWYNGVNVRPFYLKGSYNDEVEAFLLTANAIRRYSTTYLTSRFCFSDSRFLPAWLSVVQRAPEVVRRTAVPDHVGDDGLLRAENEDTQRGLTATVLPHSSRKSPRTSSNGAYALALHRGSPEGISRSDETVRGSFVRSKRLRNVHLWRWTGVGPWL